MKRRIKNLLSRLHFNEPAEDLSNEDLPVGNGGSEPETKEPSPQGQWPDNWRELYAGQDEKKLNHLSRYASPSAAFDGLIATKTKISSGEYKPIVPFPEQGTDEEKALWREQNNIPSDVNGYEFDGIDESDKEFISDLSNRLLEKNVPKQYAGEFVEFLKEQDQKAAQFEEEADANAKQAAEDKLHLEWGNDYRRNINMIHGLLDSKGLSEVILNGRGPDGIPLGSNPDVMKALADLAFELNPVSTLVPTVPGNPGASIQDEIDAIKAKMGTPEYINNEAMQERYRVLLDHRDRLKQR